MIAIKFLKSDFYRMFICWEEVIDRSHMCNLLLLWLLFIRNYVPCASSLQNIKNSKSFRNAPDCEHTTCSNNLEILENIHLFPCLIILVHVSLGKGLGSNPWIMGGNYYSIKDYLVIFLKYYWMEAWHACRGLSGRSRDEKSITF